MYLWCLFLSTHLHDPCLGRRGHDLSCDDNIMGLWLLGVHGQVVAHIGKDVGVVVALYVLVVFIRGHEWRTGTTYCCNSSGIHPG